MSKEIHGFLLYFRILTWFLSDLHQPPASSPVTAFISIILQGTKNLPCSSKRFTIVSNSVIFFWSRAGLGLGQPHVSRHLHLCGLVYTTWWGKCVRASSLEFKVSEINVMRFYSKHANYYSKYIIYFQDNQCDYLKGHHNEYLCSKLHQQPLAQRDQL